MPCQHNLKLRCKIRRMVECTEPIAAGPTAAHLDWRDRELVAMATLSLQLVYKLPQASWSAISRFGWNLFLFCIYIIHSK